jgi:hypothetical protein
MLLPLLPQLFPLVSLLLLLQIAVTAVDALRCGVPAVVGSGWHAPHAADDDKRLHHIAA